MKNINMVCPIGYTGYGITSLNILKELYHKCDITLFNIGDIGGVNFTDELSLIESCVKKQPFYGNESTILKIWHQHDLSMRPGKGKYCVFPFFELDTLSNLEIHQLNSTDLIFTASAWSKNVLHNNGIIKPIIICPLGVDTTIFKPLSIKPHYKYIFFHIGKWEKRKSQDIIIECFNKAFTTDDDVELWFFPYNPFLTESEQDYWLKMVQTCKLSDKIKILPRLQTQYELAKYINMADCGIFVSRAEGWNNEILETMAINKPVIVTNYSAHTEYCNEDNSILINISSTEKAFDNKWFNGQGNWAKIADPEKDDIIENMRMVYKNNIRLNPKGLQTARLFSWEKTAEIIYANT
jgi:glycosyltransferase involved in cell wall biosynthesis